MNRRRFTMGALAGAIGASAPAFGAGAGLTIAESGPGLNDLARKSGLLFGASVSQEVTWTPAYEKLYKQHAGVVTLDWAAKFGTVRKSRDAPDFVPTDLLVNWAKKSGIAVRGHTLIWNSAAPSWLWTPTGDVKPFGFITPPLTKREAQAAFDRHIDEMLQRYAGKIKIWDVVNEPIWPGHGYPNGLRGTIWYDVYGPGYIERALRRAHAADPSIKLFINEAGTEHPGGKELRRQLLRLIDRLQDAGAPLHGVGLEGHLIAADGYDRAGFRATLRELEKRKLEIHVTEFDVWDDGLSPDPEVRDREVADFAKPFIEDALASPNMTMLIAWQLSDGHTWLKDQKRKTPGTPRPLPFDDQYRPKPLAQTLASAFQKRAVRSNG